jgi:hypothetical protein
MYSLWRTSAYARLTMRSVTLLKRRNRLLRAGIAFALFAILAVWACYGGLTVRHYTVETEKLSPGESVRIVVVADLHSRIWGEDQQPLFDMISAQQPDIIALAGDIVDDGEPIAGAQLFIEGVAGIAPTYYISGNHEFWSGDYDGIKAMIEGYGITVLSNESMNIPVNGVRICLCGVDDPYVFRYTKDPELRKIGNEKALLRQRFSDLDSAVYTVLLAHRPEYIESYLKYDFDLILSGHTHGGQVRIPLLLNGLLAPAQGWFPKYAGGRYDFNGRTMIVSRGAGAGNDLPRIFNPPETVVVDITGEE